MKKDTLKEEALRYHEYPRPGKIEITPTKPYRTQYDLGLAYSPGVAYPSKAIEESPANAYRYTDKGNLVAVISNGTAVLGLGDIGSEASKPVMEGKALLFKIFADIDSFDIEVDEKDPQKVIEVVRAIAGTFGGINLEDIKAPDCFVIEDGLKNRLDIPVMHDDQHGTAIISGAALLNALELQGKSIGEVRVVVNGAGAASTSCIKLFIELGVNPDNIVVCDSKGVITTRRSSLSFQKAAFARDVPYETLANAMKGADVFLGLSVADVVTPDMIKSMAPRPIVFALANPDPEIAYDVAKKTRDDLIFATGRSDYPNQVNNVLGFPYIFRGALDCRASVINEDMKIAAVHAIADLAHLPVPDSVRRAVGGRELSFGKEYIIPTPFDPRLISTVAPAVAKAAADSGVAKEPIQDYGQYARHLSMRVHRDNATINRVMEYATRGRHHHLEKGA
ncbi:MAG: NADP-dependent malic enzyme [Muribaculaceae bacterium]|nr:NADP-dependent malic enzyme [Muribaculaceae bacterium]